MPSQVFIIISVILGACGQIFMKLGASALSENSHTLWGKVCQYATNLPLLTGLALYGLSAFVWISAIQKVQLSYAYPMAALSYVLVAVMSVWIFHEPMSITRMVGLAIIIIGVVVISQS